MKKIIKLIGQNVDEEAIFLAAAESVRCKLEACAAGGRTGYRLRVYAEAFFV